MVNYTISLDATFASLSDATRRDILQRIAGRDLTVSEIAAPYNISLAAISKHLKILERAALIVKHRRGKQQIVSLSPDALTEAASYLQRYQAVQLERFTTLEKLLQKEDYHA